MKDAYKLASPWLGGWVDGEAREEGSISWLQHPGGRWEVKPGSPASRSGTGAPQVNDS